MNRRSLSYNWTEEDRLTWVTWRRHMAVFYGCVALLIFGFILGSAITAARADESSDALYPGRYVANCKPAPIVGCVCKTDSTGPTRQIFQTAGESDDHEGRPGDIQYQRMMEWLRATCSAAIRPVGLR